MLVLCVLFSWQYADGVTISFYSFNLTNILQPPPPSSSDKPQGKCHGNSLELARWEDKEEKSEEVRKYCDQIRRTSARWSEDVHAIIGDKIDKDVHLCFDSVRYAIQELVDEGVSSTSEGNDIVYSNEQAFAVDCVVQGRKREREDMGEW